MGDNHAGSDDDLDVLFDRVSNKLGWKSDANFDELFEQLSQSTKKKKNKRPIASGTKKKKSKTATKKKTQDLLIKQSKPSGTSPFSSRNHDQSTKNARNSQSPKAAIRNEISRNLKLEFQAGRLNGANISAAKEEESETVEVLRDAAAIVFPESKRDCVSPTGSYDDARRTLCELEDSHSDDKPQYPDVHATGSKGDRQEKLIQSSKDDDFENKENIQTLDDANSITEKTFCSDEDVRPSDTKLDGNVDKSLSTSRVVEEDDVAQIFTKDFTESPQPMCWLMSPPASKPVPSKLTPLKTLTSDSNDDDSNTDENDVDIGDIMGSNLPSLSERLAHNRLESKRKEAASKKNRRRSCANPRSAPFVVDHEWAQDQQKSGQDDEDGDKILDGEPRLEAEEDDGEEERVQIDRDEQEVTGVSKGFEDHDNHDPVLQRKDRPALNTNAESFQKARTRYQDSSSDDDFEAFLNAVKTPQHSKQQVSQSDSDEAVYVVDDDDDFINDRPLESKSDDDDDDIFYLKVNNLDNPLTSGKRRTKKHPTVGSRSGSILSQILSSDDDEDVFVIPNPTPSVRSFSTKASTSTTPSKKTPSKPRRPLQPTSLPTNRCFSTPSRSEHPAQVSFLASLSTPGKGMSTRSRYVSDFKRNKDELTQKLFKLYNESIFENKLPSDFSITWNTRMRKTAGFCFYKKKLGDIRTARIELSVKVCDTAERLRDTLVHELCHAASWLIHGVSDGHGKFWKYWAAKANIAHPEIPIIKRCHTYEINTKFKYKCVQCGNIIGRHSKSVDTKRFCCAYCNGHLELQPTLRKDGTPARARGTNPFAAFVKENYGSVKKTHGAAKHAEVMRLLSQEFASKTKIMDT